MSAEPTMLDDIKADEIVTMTRTWSLLFKHAGCDPTCHACQKALRVGSKFKLATVDGSFADKVDVMLCATCTPSRIKDRKRKAMDRQRKRNLASGGTGCYRINGKIVP